MSGFEPLIPVAACAGAKAANKAVKEVTGKSIVSHCKSAAKGLRNIVLQKAGEKASKEAEELLFNKKERAEFKRRLDSLEYLLDDVASNSAMAADPSVVAELEALCSVLKKAASARLDADGRSDALTAIDRHMNSLHLALAANTNKKIQNVEEKLDGVVDGVVEKVGQRLDGALDTIGANVEQKLDGAVDRIKQKVGDVEAKIGSDVDMISRRQEKHEQKLDETRGLLTQCLNVMLSLSGRSFEKGFDLTAAVT